jgi:putative ABC transport system substrate-binding protein
MLMSGRGVRRRKFIVGLGFASGVWPLAVRAQQPTKVRRIGAVFAGNASDPRAQANVAAFIRELVPGVTRLAWLTAGETDAAWRRDLEILSRRLNFDLLVADHPTTDFQNAFALILREKAGALYVAQGADNYAYRGLIADFAARNHLPAMYGTKEFVDAGGLISYGPDISEVYRRGAAYVDRILKGATPSEMPVEQPTKFELIINLKAAKALGLTVPPSLVARADELVE